MPLQVLMLEKSSLFTKKPSGYPPHQGRNMLLGGRIYVFSQIIQIITGFCVNLQPKETKI
jgi:hypothetical protein